MTLLSQKYIEDKLKGTPFKVAVRESVSSTNDILKELAKNGEEAFSVLISAHQTKGKGRLGRTFYSPENTGLYMSILLRPFGKWNPLFITTDAAVACARALENLSGKNALIKWVNDIYIDGRKVCGILTEGKVGENGYAVLGIGINLTVPKEGFPDDIKDRAGYVFENDVPFLREDVAAELLCEFLKIHTSDNKKSTLYEYQNRSMVIGKEIEIIKDEKHEKATAIEISDDYSLLAKKEDGEIVRLSSGEISIKI